MVAGSGQKQHIRESDELRNIIISLAKRLDEKERISLVRDILNAAGSGPMGMPISIFKSDLSGLEAVVLYLKDNEKRSFKDIAHILNRKQSTIYNTYKNSKHKFKGRLDIKDTSVTIPYDVFKDRSHSVLEALILHLRTQDVAFERIAKLLCRSESTIRTTYWRHTQKTTARTR